MTPHSRLGARRAAAFLVLALALIAVPTAGASSEHGHPYAADVAAALMGGHVEVLAGGFYRVTTPAGYVMTTHGPDSDELAVGHNETLGPGDPERPPTCVADGYAAHVLYGRPAVIAPDRLDSQIEEIRAHIRRMNAVVNEASLASGGPTADLKVLCDDQGQIRVDSFVNNTLIGYFTTVVDAARSAGFNDPKIDYIIFYDDIFPGVCGIAELARDEQPGEGNRNNDGGYGITYKNCWYSRTPLHENGHTQGAVQDNAPNEDGTNHCTEQQDIMCYPSSSSQCTIQHFDCGFDTYFDSAPESGEWLASHWNIGSPANRYIVLGGNQGGSAAPSDPDPQPSPSESAGDTIDPGAQLHINDRTPPRGSNVQALAYLDECGGLGDTKIHLQKKVDGVFRTVARRAMNDDCVAIFSIHATFRSAVFRSFWPQQDEDYHESMSPRRRVRTH